MTWRTDMENAPRVAGSPNLQRLFDTRRELRDVEAVKCEAVTDEAMARDGVEALGGCGGMPRPLSPRPYSETGVGSERSRSHSSQSDTE